MAEIAPRAGRALGPPVRLTVLVSLRYIVMDRQTARSVVIVMRIKQSWFLYAFVFPSIFVTGSAMAQAMSQGMGAYSTGNPNTQVMRHMTEPGRPLSRQFSAAGANAAPGVPYVTNPYGGMFGSMGNVYSPYYRQYHSSGMAGAGPVVGVSGFHYIVNPYAGMYGSMGNVYSPYYRQFHQYGMVGMTGAPNRSVGSEYHYPYFLPPTMGGM